MISGVVRRQEDRRIGWVLRGLVEVDDAIKIFTSANPCVDGGAYGFAFG